MISMWQEIRGENYFRFQTKNKDAAQKMKRRSKFKLAAWGVNCDWWIFLATFQRPDIAKKALKTLAGNTVKFDKKDDVFYAPIYLTEKENEAA